MRRYVYRHIRYVYFQTHKTINKVAATMLHVFAETLNRRRFQNNIPTYQFMCTHTTACVYLDCGVRTRVHGRDAHAFLWGPHTHTRRRSVSSALSRSCSKIGGGFYVVPKHRNGFIWTLCVLAASAAVPKERCVCEFCVLYG